MGGVSSLRTGRHGVGQLLHIVHMTDDVARLNRWYEDVFGALTYWGTPEPNLVEAEARRFSLLMVADLCVETMAPTRPINTATTVGRFFERYGARFHSLAYKVDDLAGLGAHLLAQGVRVPALGETDHVPADLVYFFPNPRDTAGALIELCRVDMPGDPRLLADWPLTRALWEHHPLGVHGLAKVTIAVSDVERARDDLVRGLEALPLAAPGDQTKQDAGLQSDERRGIELALVQLGETTVELASPTRDDSDLAAHLARWGDMLYSVTLSVADIERATAHLRHHRIGWTQLGDRLVALDPADTFGAVYLLEELDPRPIDEHSG
jgi:catechol 2,3-dioxygenase-like lactoylglutathione lyase family enzyme